MKVIIGFILLLISSTTFAQTEKGSFMFGGTLGLSSTKFSSSTTTSLALSPKVSYFVVDRFAVGIVTPYSTAKASDNGKTFAKASTYTIGPTIRYYFIKGPLGFFPDMSYSWGWSNSESFDPTSGIVDFKSNASTSFLSAGVGMTYFLNKNVGLEGVLSYQETHRKTETSVPTSVGSSSSSSTGFVFQVGLQVYLAPRNP